MLLCQTKALMPLQTSLTSLILPVCVQISAVGPGDAGNYTCAPPSIHPHSVIVRIVDTEGKYAAVHRDGNSGNTRTLHTVMVTMVMVVTRASW